LRLLSSVHGDKPLERFGEEKDIGGSQGLCVSRVTIQGHGPCQPKVGAGKIVPPRMRAGRTSTLAPATQECRNRPLRQNRPTRLFRR
jgi:hypothetical protein